LRHSLSGTNQLNADATQFRSWPITEPHKRPERLPHYKMAQARLWARSCLYESDRFGARIPEMRRVISEIFQGFVS